MTESGNWLPPLVLLMDSGGNWDAYLTRIYAYFRADFIDSRPVFQGKQMGLKRHPMLQGKEATFWHLIQTGSTEQDRTPDLRRCERIRWPRPMIEAFQTERVKCWRNERKGQKGIIIALGDFSYLVVLRERRNQVLLWTAYYVERDHQRRKHAREFQEAQKKLGPPPYGNDPVTPSTHGG